MKFFFREGRRMLQQQSNNNKFFNAAGTSTFEPSTPSSSNSSSSRPSAAATASSSSSSGNGTANAAAMMTDSAAASVRKPAMANEDGALLLAPWTFSCLFRPSIERLKRALGENPEATQALNHLQEVFHHVDRASPSFLYDFSKLLLNESGLGDGGRINLQESYLRMQASAPNDEFELPQFAHIREFQLLSVRAIALRKVLARIPDEMADRRPFLETIKEIASSIKHLLDTTNAIISIVPYSYQPLVEKRKREFVHVSKRFSNTLKEYFKQQDPGQVFIAANQLIMQTMKLCLAIRDRVRMD